MPNQQLLSQFLTDQPYMTYMAQMPQLADPMRRYYTNAYNDIYGQYQGALGQQAMGGQNPGLNFQAWLAKYPWLQDYQGRSQYSRGYFPQTYAPRARFLNY